MIKYPLSFTVHSKGAAGVPTPIEASAENFPPIAGAIPKEFGGPGGGYSPEDLFAISVISCLIATFKVFAEKGKLVYTEISAEAKLGIDRNAEGVPEFQTLEMSFTLTGVEDQEKAKTLLAESQKYCLVSNAITCKKTFNYAFA